MFCGACGKPLGEGVKFCPECGAPVRRSPAASELPANIPQPAAPQAPAAPVAAAAPAAGTTAKSIEQALLLGTIMFGAGALLVLMTGNLPVFLIDAAVAGVSYAFGYQNFKQGKLKEAKTASLVMGVAAGVFLLMALSYGSLMFVLLNGIAGAAFIYASTKL